MPMRLADVALDVHPPRARGWRKWLRRLFPVERARRAARAIRERQGLLPRMPVLFVTSPWPMLLRLPVAGWPQLHLRRQIRGRLFFWGFLAFFIPGLLMIGTFSGSLLLGLAFGIHASGILDLMNLLSPRMGLWPQLLRSIAVMAMLFLFLYLPAGRLAGQFANVRVIQLGQGALHTGDVLLVNHRAYRSRDPSVGDVVLFNSGRQTFNTTGPEGRGAAIYIWEGEYVDRVLAGPGDHVVWERGALAVNGVASQLQPINPGRLSERLELRVPSGHYFILPTTTPNLDIRAPGAVWKEASCVPRDAILGRVYLRKNPLSRLGPL